MAKNITLNAQKRTVTGRKVKQLRAQGIIPGNVYGAGVASQAISFSEQVFKDVFKDAGETHVVDLLIKGEKNSRPTLIYQVQTDPITRRLLHVDFRQVNLKEKINAVVPVELVGESEAEAQGAVIVTLRDEVEVEALPTEIPETIKLDVSKLRAIDDTLTVADISVDPDKVKVLLDTEEVLVKAEAPREEEVEPEVTETETPEGEETTETTEGEAETKEEGEKKEENEKSAE